MVLLRPLFCRFLLSTKLCGSLESPLHYHTTLVAFDKVASPAPEFGTSGVDVRRLVEVLQLLLDLAARSRAEEMIQKKLAESRGRDSVSRDWHCAREQDICVGIPPIDSGKATPSMNQGMRQSRAPRSRISQHRYKRRHQQLGGQRLARQRLRGASHLRSNDA